jgi:hypothetical protein
MIDTSQFNDEGTILEFLPDEYADRGRTGVV